MDAEDRTQEETFDRPESSMSVQDARIYANRVLHSVGGVSTRDISPESAERTQAISGGKNYNDRQVKTSPAMQWKRPALVFLAVLLLLIAIAIATYIFGVVRVVNNAKRTDDGGATTPSDVPTTPTSPPTIFGLPVMPSFNFTLPETPKVDQNNSMVWLARTQAAKAFLSRFSGSTFANLDDP